MNLGGTKLRGYHYWWELVTAKQLSHLKLSQGISIPIYLTSGRPALGLPPLSQDCKSHHTDATQVNVFIKGWGKGAPHIVVWTENHNWMTSWVQMNLKPKVRKLNIRLLKLSCISIMDTSSCVTPAIQVRFIPHEILFCKTENVKLPYSLWAGQREEELGQIYK